MTLDAVGIDPDDASTTQNRTMHACLLWTNSDLTAYADAPGGELCGGSRMSLVTDAHITCSRWLRDSGKHRYMGSQSISRRRS